MKKIIFLTLMTVTMGAFMVACNGSDTHNEASVDEHQHSGEAELSLNNGAKWTVDTTTNRNYVEMKTMTNMFAVDPNPSLETYQTFGNELNGGIQRMIDQCKMQGDDHDALHQWLNPLIHQSNELKTVSDTGVARKIFDSVHTRIDLFPQYFATPL